MAEDIERIRMVCQQCIQKLKQLLSVVKSSLHTEGIDATDVDVHIEPIFQEAYSASISLLENLLRLRLDRLEPLKKELKETICDLKHAEHVVSEEKQGLYRFGWPWEESIPEWISFFQKIDNCFPPYLK
jgi:hypothetical protein